MSVLLCAGKLTDPIKYNTDNLGIEGVSYTEHLEDYLQFNKQIEKIIFIETVENQLKVNDLEGYDGELTIITNALHKYKDYLEDDILKELEESEEFEEESEEESEELEEESEGANLEESKELKVGILEGEGGHSIKDYKIVSVKELEGIRVSDIQWELLNS